MVNGAWRKATLREDILSSVAQIPRVSKETYESP